MSEVSDRARTSALRLLKVRPRSESELRQRLTRKGFSPATVDGIIEEFKRKGLLDDAKVARFLAVQTLTMKPLGKRGLEHTLKSKGIPPDLVSQAVEEATAGTDQFQTARDLAQQRMSALKGLDRSAVERRLFGFLSRRGFSSDLIYKVVRETVRPS